MFGFIKKTLQKIYSHVTSKLATLFGRGTVDEATLKELEILLIEADTGVQTTKSIVAALHDQVASGAVTEGHQLRDALQPLLLTIVTKPPKTDYTTRVHLLVGINGSGKTTFAGKLAYQYVQQGKKVLLVAADTFRAAAPEQLTRWAEKCGAVIELGTPGQDPASVVFAGCKRFVREGFDHLIIDTAGRLQTKVNLMRELEKIKRVVDKVIPNEKISTVLTIDSMLGQNSFEQAKLFKESTNVNGIALTKMDGTGKGGIVFGIADQLDIPIAYITFGEQLEQIKPFDAHTYVQELLQ